MIGTSWIREQGYKDPLLLETMRRHELTSVALYDRDFPERDAQMKRWGRARRSARRSCESKTHQYW